MRCEKCKTNIASSVVKKSLDGKAQSVHLCESCMKEIELTLMIESIFSDIFDNFKYKPAKKQSKKCSSCGLSISDLSEDSTLGCAACYKAYQGAIAQLLSETQYAARHEGKIPVRSGVLLQREREIIKLRNKMDKSVKEENYEMAAQYRDLIRRLNDVDSNNNETEEVIV